MPKAPKPLATFMVGHGDDAVSMGLYAFSTRDDSNSNIYLSRGFTVCPVGSTEQNMEGFYDPEQNTRIDFSDRREGAVAIAGGTEKPDQLSDAQHQTARNFVAAMEKRIGSVLQEYQHQRDISVDRIRPTSFTEGNAWERGQSESLHVHYAVESRRDIISGLADDMISAFEHNAQRFNDLNAPPKPVSVPLAPSTRVKDAPAETQVTSAPTRDLAEDIAALLTALKREFPEPKFDSHVNNVISAMRRHWHKPIDPPSR